MRQRPSFAHCWPNPIDPRPCRRTSAGTIAAAAAADRAQWQCIAAAFRCRPASDRRTIADGNGRLGRRIVEVRRTGAVVAECRAQRFGAHCWRQRSAVDRASGSIGIDAAAATFRSGFAAVGRVAVAFVAAAAGSVAAAAASLVAARESAVVAGAAAVAGTAANSAAGLGSDRVAAAIGPLSVRPLASL